MTKDERELFQKIGLTAYYHWLEQGQKPNTALDDWLYAERLVEQYENSRKGFEQTLSYLKEVEEVREENNSNFVSDINCSSHMNQIDKVLWALSMISTNPTRTKSKELVTSSLFGVRLFNDVVASIELIQCGLYQQAVFPLRDIFEISSLLHLFANDRSHILKWESASEKKRRNDYKQGAIRKLLEPFDNADGIDTRKRAEFYDFLTKYGGHFNIESLELIKRDGNLRLGPFGSVGHTKAILYELAKWSRLATTNLLYLCESLGMIFDPEVIRQYKEVGFVWIKRHIPTQS